MENKIWTLLARQLTGEATPEEIKELEQIIGQDPVLAKMAQEMKDAWNDTGSHEMQKALSSFSKIDVLIQSKANETFIEDSGTPVIPMHSKLRRFRVGIAAAAMMILLVSVWFVFQNRSKPGDDAAQLATTHEISTLSKSIREVNMPDGSVIHLNEGSKVTYNDGFNSKIREVWLTGEAFFDVAKNKEKPFIVHAGKINVRVTGTAFNIRSYPDEQNVETSLVHGSVEVTVTGDPSEKYMLTPNQKLVIPAVKRDTANANNTPTADKEGKYSNLKTVRDAYSKDSVIAEISWMEGKLAFSQTSFKDLALRLEKRFNVSFVFEDKSKEDLEFTGVFYKQTLSEALHRLAIAAPFNYHINDTAVYITK